MRKKISVGSKINSSGTGGFSFDGKTSKYFENHIAKSIPFFLETHKLISKLSTFFVLEKSNVYDLGCSTGLSLRAVADFNLNKKFNLIGIDLSKDMIKRAKQNTIKKKYKNININYLCGDVLKMNLKKVT